METAECFAEQSLTVVPWPDEVIDALGHDPRSAYVETFWLGILGPSTTWLLRRLVAGLDYHPDGFELPLAETARALGLGDKGGRNSPFVRAMSRLVQFDMARRYATNSLAVRRRVPPLNRKQVMRLPFSLQEAHERFQSSDLRQPAIHDVRGRARQLALSMFELGEDLEASERQLMRWRFHPSIVRDAVTWAWDQHRQPTTPAS